MIYVSGSFRGALLLEGATLYAEGNEVASNRDAYLAELTQDGGLRRGIYLTKHIDMQEPPTGSKDPAVIALDGDEVLVAGAYTGHFGGCNPCTSAEGTGAFLHRFRDLLVQAEQLTFDGPGSQSFRDVRSTNAGNALIAGEFTEQIDLGGQVLMSNDPNDVDCFVALRDQDGVATWAHEFEGNTGVQQVRRLVRTPAGEIVAAGHFTREIVLDEHVIATGPKGDAYWEDLFVATLAEATGDIEWSFTAGSAGRELLEGLAVLPDGTLVLVATYEDPLIIGETTFEPPSGEGSHGALLFALSPEGTLRWAQAFGVQGQVYAKALAVDPNGRIVLGGSFCGELVFDTFRLSSACTSEADHLEGFVAVFEPPP